MFESYKLLNLSKFKLFEDNRFKSYLVSKTIYIKKHLREDNQFYFLISSDLEPFLQLYLHNHDFKLLEYFSVSVKLSANTEPNHVKLISVYAKDKSQISNS